MLGPEELANSDKRILGVVPNYKTVPDSSAPYSPITTKQKFYIARHDSFDLPMFGLAGMFAGLSHASNQYPSWGQGAAGYGRRYAAAMADQAIGNYLTEAVLPMALHQDPRYFRLGHGSAAKRVGYALSRVLVNRNDQGSNVFNASEILGTAMTVGIASAYYPAEQRHPGDMGVRMGTQVAFDALSGVAKEYWPDLRKRFFKK
jgi:hypothetical protein